ncbi:hypothetical protein HHI36_024204 [Cryptolaemus montrouzieri]|uniref:Retrotransposon gag domain-containing protein n=1 Tax=Cryptolaemus montrouzieri TaxID=559131 RepID=A0ABD2N0U5_9CUCU
MRSCLRNVIKLKRSGPSLLYPSYSLNCEDEFKIIENKIKEVIGLIDQFNDDMKSSLYRRINSKFAHMVKRVDRTRPTEDTKRKERSPRPSKASTLLHKLKTRVHTLHTQEPSILDASLFNIRVDSDDDSSSEESDEEVEGAFGNSTPKPAEVNKGQSSTSSQVKSFPVTKWNLQFTGVSKDMSVFAYLERVVELSCSRHVNKLELLDSVIVLFKGIALTWFRANRKKITTWNDISFALKKQFQPYDYDDRLFEEAKRRTQGENEKIDINTELEKYL